MLNKRKKILFLGKTGAGKSTIATMLLQSNDDSFPIKDSAVEATKNCDVRSNDRWMIYDTAGLGGFNGSIALQKLKVIAKKNRFHYICIVKDKGRVDQLDSQIHEEILKIFESKKVRMILIITHSDQKWLATNQDELEKIYGTIPKIAIDLPPIHPHPNIECVYTQIRINSKERFLIFIQSLTSDQNNCNIS